jgi:hypothetical protein
MKSTEPTTMVNSLSLSLSLSNITNIQIKLSSSLLSSYWQIRSLSFSLSLSLLYSFKHINNLADILLDVLNLSVTWYSYDTNLTFYLFKVRNYKYDKLKQKQYKSSMVVFFVLQILLDTNGHVSFINHWSHHTRFCSSSISCITFKKGLQRSPN